MRVSVIIPVKDDERVVRCVESVLLSALETGELEIIVVDNGSPESFAPILQRLAALPGVSVLREPKPGSYAARNAGIKHAAGEVIFFTDADAVVQPGWIREGLRAIHDGADMACGSWLSIGDSKIHRVIQTPFHFRPPPPPRRGDAAAVNTRNVAIRARVFRELLFDDRAHRGSDSAFGRIATLRGFRTYYVPEMVIAHEHEADLPYRVSKHVCWGWNRRRLGSEYPELFFPPGPLGRFVDRLESRTGIAVRSQIAAVCWQVALRTAQLAQALSPVLPDWLLSIVLRQASAFAWRSGVYRYEAGERTQPMPSTLLQRKLRRD